MNNFFSTSGIAGKYLFSFILLCGVFTSENAFSLLWDKSCVQVTYSQKANSIIFTFLFHEYTRDPDENGYLKRCEFLYSEDAKTYSHLMSVATENQKSADWVSILLRDKKNGENIQFLNPPDLTKEEIWSDGKDLKVNMKASAHPKVGSNNVYCKLAYICIKWVLPKTDKRVIFFKIHGSWYSSDKNRDNGIDEVYTLNIIKSCSNAMKITSSELKSKISDNLQLTAITDAISIKRAKPGEKIKVYTISGVEVKSVVAIDDVVNMNFPKNQIYIVKSGEARSKIAL